MEGIDNARKRLHRVIFDGNQPLLEAILQQMFSTGKDGKSIRGQDSLKGRGRRSQQREKRRQQKQQHGAESEGPNPETSNANGQPLIASPPAPPLSASTIDFLSRVLSSPESPEEEIRMNEAEGLFTNTLGYVSRRPQPTASVLQAALSAYFRSGKNNAMANAEDIRPLEEKYGQQQEDEYEDPDAEASEKENGTTAKKKNTLFKVLLRMVCSFNSEAVLFALFDGLLLADVCRREGAFEEEDGEEKEEEDGEKRTPTARPWRLLVRELMLFELEERLQNKDNETRKEEANSEAGQLSVAPAAAADVCFDDFSADAGGNQTVVKPITLQTIDAIRRRLLLGFDDGKMAISLMKKSATAENKKNCSFYYTSVDEALRESSVMYAAVSAGNVSFTQMLLQMMGQLDRSSATRRGWTLPATVTFPFFLERLKALCMRVAIEFCPFFDASDDNDNEKKDGAEERKQQGRKAKAPAQFRILKAMLSEGWDCDMSLISPFHLLPPIALTNSPAVTQLFLDYGARVGYPCRLLSSNCAPSSLSGGGAVSSSSAAAAAAEATTVNTPPESQDLFFPFTSKMFEPAAHADETIGMLWGQGGNNGGDGGDEKTNKKTTKKRLTSIGLILREGGQMAVPQSIIEVPPLISPHAAFSSRHFLSSSSPSASSATHPSSYLNVSADYQTIFHEIAMKSFVPRQTLVELLTAAEVLETADISLVNASSVQRSSPPSSPPPTQFRSCRKLYENLRYAQQSPSTCAMWTDEQRAAWCQCNLCHTIFARAANGSTPYRLAAVFDRKTLVELFDAALKQWRQA